MGYVVIVILLFGVGLSGFLAWRMTSKIDRGMIETDQNHRSNPSA